VNQIDPFIFVCLFVTVVSVVGFYVILSLFTEGVKTVRKVLKEKEDQEKDNKKVVRPWKDAA
jgi:hypothetical protein